MRFVLGALLLAALPVNAGDCGGYAYARGPRGIHVRHFRGDARNRLYPSRHRFARVDPYDYGRCYWRGYYRPYLYCREYTPRYSYYRSHRADRAPYPAYYGGCSSYGGVYHSRYGYRHPHQYSPIGSPCGAGPYGFLDPWGYRLLPAFNFAAIATRLSTTFTIDSPEFDGPEGAGDADGLPVARTQPVGARFLVSTEAG